MGYTAKLITAPQAFTAGLVDLGGEINTGGYNYLHLYLTLDINSTTDPGVKILRKHTSAGAEEYQGVIKSVAAALIKIETEIYQWNVDADGLFHIEVPLNGGVPYVQVQIIAAVVGGTAGTMDAAYYILSY